MSWADGREEGSKDVTDGQENTDFPPTKDTGDSGVGQRVVVSRGMSRGLQ